MTLQSSGVLGVGVGADCDSMRLRFMNGQNIPRPEIRFDLYDFYNYDSLMNLLT